MCAQQPNSVCCSRRWTGSNQWWDLHKPCYFSRQISFISWNLDHRGACGMHLVHPGAKMLLLFFPGGQVSHLGSLAVLPREGRLWQGSCRFFVFISPSVKGVSLDVLSWNVMSNVSQVASFKSFILLALYNEKHCVLGVVMRWLVSGRVNLKGFSEAVFHSFSPHFPYSQSYFFGPVTSHFCNLNVQMLCSHGPVAGLISDPRSGRWLICCWFQL